MTIPTGTPRRDWPTGRTTTVGRLEPSQVVWMPGLAVLPGRVLVMIGPPRDNGPAYQVTAVIGRTVVRDSFARYERYIDHLCRATGLGRREVIAADREARKAIYQ